MSGYKKTLLGTGILLVILTISLLYPKIGPLDYNKKTIILDHHSNVIGRAPFPPSLNHPFGTDENGSDLLLMMIDGAKYTILTASIVTVLRVLAGGVTGIVISFWLPKIVPYFKDLFLGFRYVPALIIAITLMTPVAMATHSKVPMLYIMMYQIFVLFLVAYPSISITTIDIINDLRSKTFIQSSYLMGANHFHIIRKQLFPYFKSYGLLIGVQQLLATLVLIMHLGLFQLYLGGPTAGGIFGYDGIPPKKASLSNEWSGLIGQNFDVLVQYPWIVLVVMLGFFLLIATVNMMKKELEERLKHDYSWRRKKVETDSKIKMEQLNPSPSEFVFTTYPTAENDVLIKKAGPGVKIYTMTAAGIAICLLILTISYMGGEKKEAIEGKKDPTDVAAVTPSTDTTSSSTPPSESESNGEELAGGFNFKQIVNQTEDHVKKELGKSQEIKKMLYTLKIPAKKIPARVYSYNNGALEVTFIEGRAKIINVYPTFLCNFFGDLKKCLNKHGLKLNKIETKNGQDRAYAKYGYGNGIDFVEIKRINVTNPQPYELVSNIWVITEKKYADASYEYVYD